MEQMLVRIRPGSRRQTHHVAGQTFHQKKSWYEVDAGLAAECQKERMSELNPDSPPVFEVATKREAEERITQNTAAVIGTLERPNVVATKAAPELASEPVRVGRRQGK